MTPRARHSEQHPGHDEHGADRLAEAGGFGREQGAEQHAGDRPALEALLAASLAHFDAP